MDTHIPLENLNAFLSHLNAQRVARLSALTTLENTANTLFTANQHFAIYGSLAPGKPNHNVIEALAGRWMSGQVYGELTQDGWGAEMGFPGILLGEAQETVAIELLISHVLPEHWDRLDDFEGKAYQRSLVPVHCEDGQIRVANIYALARSNSDD